jgi:hypothetical protein
MTGSALFDFLIACIVLVAVVALFFIAMDRIAPDATFAKIAKIAVGVVALIAFLGAIRGIFFGGGGSMPAIGGGQLIEFAVGLIVILVVVWICYMVVDFFGFMATEVKYVVGAIALIILLLLAGRALFGGGLGIMPSMQRRGDLNSAVVIAYSDHNVSENTAHRPSAGCG